MKITITLNKKSNLQGIGEKTIKYFLLSSSEQLTNDLKDNTPAKGTEGNLRNAWKPEPVRNKKLRVTNDTKYAIFVEKGTGIFGPRRHRIFPRKARALRAKINGEWVFFKHSRGQPGQHMTEKGVKAFRPKIPNLMRTAIIKTSKGGK